MSEDVKDAPHAPAAPTEGGVSDPERATNGAAGGAPPPPDDPKEKARAYLATGQSLYRERKFDEALVKFELALTFDPHSAEVHKWRGDALGEKFMYKEAVEAYDEAVKADRVAAEPATVAEAYFNRGEIFYHLRRFGDAVESFRQAYPRFDELAGKARADSDPAAARNYEAVSGDVHNSLGYALLELKLYDEATGEFRVASAKGAQYPYAYHSYASLLWTWGRYAEAKVQWDAAYVRYNRDAAMEEAEREGWPGHFYNFANMLHEVYGELDSAERMYHRALKITKESTATMAGLLNLYIEKAGRAECRADSYWKAKQVYEEATRILRGRLKGVEDLDSMIRLGELHLAWNDYDGSGRWREEEGRLAEEWLTKALKKDEADGRTAGYTRTAKPAANLGVAHARRKEYKKAIDFFEQALKIDNGDLTLRSNLAEAYLRDKQFDEAEREYRYVLAVAPEHIESLIGLGEIHLARGDAGDLDMYEEAAESFRVAVGLAEKRRGSKRLKKKELAKVHYLRAYAMVKSFEGSKLLRDHNLLWSARTDFKACARHDPEYYNALRAIEKIEKNLGVRSPQRLLEKLGPLAIFGAAAFVLGLVQWGFYGGGVKFGVGEYAALTFGLLALMAASAYLPQILKLKVAGIELEKSTVDQVATLGTLGITRGV